MGDPAFAWSFLVWTEKKKSFDQQIKKAQKRPLFFNSSLWLSFVSPWGGNCSPTERNNDLYFSLLRNVWMISEPLLLDPPFSPSLPLSGTTRLMKSSCSVALFDNRRVMTPRPKAAWHQEGHLRGTGQRCHFAAFLCYLVPLCIPSQLTQLVCGDLVGLYCGSCLSVANSICVV